MNLTPLKNVFLKTNRKERIGFIILTFVILISFSSIFIVPLLVKQNEYANFEFEKEIDSLINLIDNKNSLTVSDNAKPKKEYTKTAKQKAITNNYYSYYNKDTIAPKIAINKKIELNSCKADDLAKTAHINHYLAERIIKYRHLLGGFVSSRQLWEVYGLDSNAFKNVTQHIYINDSIIEKISINSSNYQAFIKHPYLNKYQVNAIINYRDFKENKITEIDELTKNKALTPEELTKIKPYLIIE